MVVFDFSGYTVRSSFDPPGGQQNQVKTEDREVTMLAILLETLLLALIFVISWPILKSIFYEDFEDIDRLHNEAILGNPETEVMIKVYVIVILKLLGVGVILSALTIELMKSISVD